MVKNVQKNVGNVGNDTILNKSIEQQFKRKQKMNLENISKSTPIEPEINADGWYAQCVRCWHEITPTDNICPKCKQVQDWSWFGKTKKIKEESV